jgi:hypothetical protein
MVRFLAAALAAAVALPAPAAPRFVSFTLENDFLAGYDRHYTNGVQAAWLADMDELPQALRALPPLSWSEERDVVMAIGQRIYTPIDQSREVPDPGDRPYAGWLYLLTEVRTRKGPEIDHVSGTIGIAGPASLGRQTQDLAHALIGQERAQGWDSQLHNRATFTLGFERTWPRVAQAQFAGHRADLAMRAGATVGNVFTYANVGAVARYGDNLPDDVPTTHISLAPSRDGYRGSQAARGWYAWLGVDARAVARNLFLEGVTRKPYGGDLQAGVALTWPGARLAFALVQRSPEFEGQAGPDRFGQLAVSFAY